jgi:hypothetical protein
MTWTDTHRRWQVLHEIEELAADRTVEELPWRPQYAALFGTPDGLAAALRTRVEQTRQAQLDTHLPEPVLEENWHRLEARHAGVLRLLERHEQAKRLGVPA